MDPEKPEKKHMFSGVIMAFLWRKTSKCIFCDMCDVLTHQRVCVLQVVVTVPCSYGCLTGVSSYFQLFELCKRAADGRNAILHQSDGVAKWSTMVRCFPFLEETSERDEI